MQKWHFTKLWKSKKSPKNSVAARLKTAIDKQNRSGESTSDPTTSTVDTDAGTQHGSSGVDMSTTLAGTQLHSPVICAAGASGYGAELEAYFPLKNIGGIVAKSLLHKEWEGNPAPRVASVDSAMINSVGLSGPGIEIWKRDYLPELQNTGANVVASIWGRSVSDYELAAQMLSDISDQLLAIEVNISCPNVEDRNNMFAHSAGATEEVLSACSSVGANKLWAKLSPNIFDLVPIAEAAQRGGADAVTVANTMIGLAIDIDKRKPKLGKGRGGLSGPGIRPIAVRATHDIATALPDLDVIGCGGIRSGRDALEYLIAGAKAVQVGTAIFADPRAPQRINNEISDWCEENGVEKLADVIATLQYPK